MAKRPGWSLVASPSQILAALGIAAARRSALMRAGIELQSEWKQILKQPGSGRTYEAGVTFITHKGRVIPVKGSPGSPSRSGSHVASAPGEPPASDTGTLASSISVVQNADGSVRVGTNLRYGLALEYGVNVSGSKVGPHPAAGFMLQPRPHARPAAKAAEGSMTEGMVLGFSDISGPRIAK